MYHTKCLPGIYHRNRSDPSKPRITAIFYDARTAEEFREGLSHSFWIGKTVVSQRSVKALGVCVPVSVVSVWFDEKAIANSTDYVRRGLDFYDISIPDFNS